MPVHYIINYILFIEFHIFLNIQRNLSKIESQLQAARRIFNNDVTKYNTKINIVPYNIIAILFGFNEKSLFQINDETKNNISVDL